MIHPAKILLITNIPTPYRIPLFNEIDKQLRDAGLAFKVAFAMPGYRRRKWEIDLSECKFEYEFLSSSRALRLSQERTIFTYGGFLGLLKKERPMVTVVTGFSIATTKLWLRQIWTKMPYIIWSGAIDSPARPVSRLRTWHRRMLVRKAAAYIAYGSRAKSYLMSLGAKEGRVFIGINTVDIDFFSQIMIPSSDQVGKQSEKKRLLYVGNLTRGKRLDLLLQALCCLSIKRTDFVLHIVGDGPERENLVTLATQMKISTLVSFEGHVQKHEIRQYLAQTVCFLFPSEYDIWGLVLNEAMASSVPCLASVHAGATADLIKDGDTGFVLDFSDHRQVAKRIEWILDHPRNAAALGVAGRKFIEERANLSVSAGGVVDAILACGTANAPRNAVK